MTTDIAYPTRSLDKASGFVHIDLGPGVDPHVWIHRFDKQTTQEHLTHQPNDHLDRALKDAEHKLDHVLPPLRIHDGSLIDYGNIDWAPIFHFRKSHDEWPDYSKSKRVRYL